MTIWGDHLVVDDQQHGFKHGSGCTAAFFVLHTAGEYFTNHGSTVYVAALDTWNAFDNVNHCKLFREPLDRGTPTVLVIVPQNWYSMLRAPMSDYFTAANDIRQGNVLCDLCPSLISTFINILIVYLHNSQSGCCFKPTFIVKDPLSTGPVCPA
jgi:Reverse transcriptase (RNA-dependent DNA polymerase)